MEVRVEQTVLIEYSINIADISDDDFENHDLFVDSINEAVLNFIENEDLANCEVDRSVEDLHWALV